MVCVEKMRKYFNKMFDKITAKRIIKDIKLNIKYDDIGTKRVGVWWDAISEGTIKILQDKGYVVRKSATNNNRFFVLFRDADIGIPLNDKKSVSTKESEE